MSQSSASQSVRALPSSRIMTFLCVVWEGMRWLFNSTPQERREYATGRTIFSDLLIKTGIAIVVFIFALVASAVLETLRLWIMGS